MPKVEGKANIKGTGSRVFPWCVLAVVGENTCSHVHGVTIFILECCIRLLIVSVLGVRPVGYEAGDRFVKLPEMIPKMIVPDLTSFKVVLYCS